MAAHYGAEMAKTVLITGAGSGFGRGAAIELAARGHRVIATTETVEQAEALRNYLYTKMRGVRDGSSRAASHGDTGSQGIAATPDETLVLLTDIRDSLRRLDKRLGRTGPAA